MIIPEIPPRVEEMLTQFRLSNQTLRDISEAMHADFQLGLLKGVPHSSVAMLPTFLPALPDGTESGRYLSMDLSGTNLRIMLLSLHGKNAPPEVLKHNFIVMAEIMTGTKQELFDFIVRCLVKFLTEHDLLDKELPLGFVFSYPCAQKSLRSASLLWWTKGFNVEAVIGNDVVQLLEEAIDRHGGINVRVRAIMNDTVGQLAAAAYQYGPDCLIGVVVGNGCNASYVEKTSNIRKFDSAVSGYKYDEMVIDTEWEDFGNNGQLDFIKTDFDREIDQLSIHKGRQTIDKLTGALYLGELCRRVLEQLTIDGVIFGGQLSDELSTVNNFPTKYIAEILSDEGGAHFKSTRRIIEELQILNHATTDYIVMGEVCRVISQRGAGIVAAAICALMRVVNKSNIVVGVGGTLHQYHPIFHALLEGKVADIAPTGFQWRLATAEDGSGRGAALVAAVAEKMKLA